MDTIFYTAIIIAGLLITSVVYSVIITIKLERLKTEMVLREINQLLKDEVDFLFLGWIYKKLSHKKLHLLPSTPMENYLKAKIKNYATLARILGDLEGCLDHSRKIFLKDMIDKISGRVIAVEKIAEIYAECLSLKADGVNTGAEEKFLLNAISQHSDTDKLLFQKKVTAQMGELIDVSSENLDRQIMLRTKLIGFKRIHI